MMPEGADPGNGADLEEVHNTERHLLYAACTPARDHMLVDQRRSGAGIPGRSAEARGLGMERGARMTRAGSSSFIVKT